MEGLVTVGFRSRAIVLDLTDERAPAPVHDPQGLVAVVQGRHDHAYGHQVINLANIMVIALQLEIKAIETLGATVYIDDRHAVGGQFLQNLLLKML